MPNITFFKTHEDYLNWYRRYKRKNKNKLKKYHREYERRLDIATKRHNKRKDKRKNNPKYRLDCNVSSVINLCLKGNKDFRRWQDLVGYSIGNLMIHLEKQFDNKMNWNNYGSYWHLDHKKPKSLFKYETAENPEFKKCWSLKNLQPLERITNLKKGNTY